MSEILLSEAEKVLHARALELARAAPQASPGETLEVVEFALSSEHYGIETTFVREVYPLKDLTPLPCTPSWVRGIVNVRSQIVAVIDVKRFFDLPTSGLGDLNKILILQSGEVQFGILADFVVGIRLLEAEEMQASSQALPIARREYVKGVTAERLVILDAERILHDERIVVDETVDGA